MALANLPDNSSASEPEKRWDDDGTTISVWAKFGKRTVTFHFSDIIDLRRFDAEVFVYWDCYSNHDVTMRVRCLDAGSVSAFERYLKSMECDDQYCNVDWPMQLQDAIGWAREAYSRRNAGVDLAALEVPDDDDLIAGLVSAGGVTILFGAGECGKGHTTLSMATAIGSGTPYLGRATKQTGVCWLGYEERTNELARRYKRHLRGLQPDTAPGTFRYLNGRGVGVVEQLTHIRDELMENGIGLLVVDSAAFAIGNGNPSEAGDVTSLFNAFNSLGVAVVLIAHNDKNGNEMMPFGSVFWHTSARMTWHVRRLETGGRDLHVGFTNRKNNDGVRQPSFGVAVHFDDDADRTGAISVEPLAANADAGTLADRIIRILRNGHQSNDALAFMLGTTPATIRSCFNKSPKLQAYRPDGVPVRGEGVREEGEDGQI